MATRTRRKESLREISRLTTHLDHQFAKLAFSPGHASRAPWRRKTAQTMRQLRDAISTIFRHDDRLAESARS
jgi:hypothetical protein